MTEPWAQGEVSSEPGSDQPITSEPSIPKGKRLVVGTGSACIV